MRKTSSIHHKQENEHGLPRSIIAMDKRSVNRFCSSKQTANEGSGPLSRRNRVVGSGRDHANPCVSWRSCCKNRNKRCFSVYASGIWMPGRRVGKSGGTSRCPCVLLPCWHGCYACGKAKSGNCRW